MKITTLFVCLFKCSFLKRVCAVIFELDEVSTSFFIKFQFQRMTLKIERVFEKIPHTGDTQTDKQIHGHRDYSTNSAQRAELAKRNKILSHKTVQNGQ